MIALLAASALALAVLCGGDCARNEPDPVARAIGVGSYALVAAVAFGILVTLLGRTVA